MHFGAANIQTLHTPLSHLNLPSNRWRRGSMLASGMGGIVFWEWLSTQESFIGSFSDAVAINAGLEDLQTRINHVDSQVA